MVEIILKLANQVTTFLNVCLLVTASSMYTFYKIIWIVRAF